MGDWQQNEPSDDTAGRASGTAIQFFSPHDVALLLEAFSTDDFVREAPGRDAVAGPERTPERVVTCVEWDRAFGAFAQSPVDAERAKTSCGSRARPELSRLCSW